MFPTGHAPNLISAALSRAINTFRTSSSSNSKRSKKKRREKFRRSPKSLSNSSMTSSSESSAEIAVNGEDDGGDLLIECSKAFQFHGRDKRGRWIVLIVGKFFPGRLVGEKAVMRYLEKKVFPDLKEKKPFVVVYVHSLVRRADNYPGVAALRSALESIPKSVHDGLEAVFFIHPGLQSRLFLATIGRFLFRSELYEKIRYVSRLEYLWEEVRKGELDLPEFVEEHDEELERRPLMDYCIETDRNQFHEAPAMDSAASMRSLRCIS